MLIKVSWYDSLRKTILLGEGEEVVWFISDSVVCALGPTRNLMDFFVAKILIWNFHESF